MLDTYYDVMISTSTDRQVPVFTIPTYIVVVLRSSSATYYLCWPGQAHILYLLQTGGGLALILPMHASTDPKNMLSE